MLQTGVSRMYSGVLDERDGFLICLNIMKLGISEALYDFKFAKLQSYSLKLGTYVKFFLPQGIPLAFFLAFLTGLLLKKVLP